VRIGQSPVVNYSEISVVILAGGMGTRLRSVVADRPKVLAQVAGRPFLAHLLDQLAAAGVRSALLCTGYRAEAVVEQFGATYRSLALTYSQETVPLGTGGALGHARPHLHSDPVLVLNGDSYCAADLAAFLDWHYRSQAQASLLLTEVADTSRYGRVEVDGAGSVLGFAEKAVGSGPGWINAGVYLLSQPFLEALPEGRPLSLEREVFPSWVGRGLTAYRSPGWFIDIGTPESYARAEQLFTARAT
jgi:NDP-sugar pyrophosphorylase family protein